VDRSVDSDLNTLPGVVGSLPAPTPLPMPVQSLDGTFTRLQRLPSSPRAIGLRRFAVIGSATALAILASYEIYLVLGVNGPTPLAIIMVLLFAALFAWIALSFTSALVGFCSMLAGGGGRLLRQESGLPSTRTALLMPVYNESPRHIMAGLRATWESLQKIGPASESFDAFILSDTTDPDTWIDEESAFLELRAQASGYNRIFYRRRLRNTARKSGNIADWITRFGAAYEQFLILDADSVMTGDALVRLVDAMERHSDVGLIQTLPTIAGGNTLFARTQQFAGRIYGPVIAHGIAFWHGAEGNYWGHNAIIRTRAFAAAAGLPELPGPKPFGGAILSHDFVEAALLRRAGWAVHMVPALAGSYEASPPTLTDLAIRDRRWCQGNLQHALVLPARGLHWVSRLHLMTGIGSYITAPLWLMFLLCGILIAIQARFIPPNYFPSGPSLFPVWPVIDPVRAMWMFVGTMTLLLLPKLFGFLAAILCRPVRRGCGGVLRLFASMVLETVLSGLIAPVTMLTQMQHVIAIMFRGDSGWIAQQRDDGRMPLRIAARQYRWHTLLGVAFGGCAWAVSSHLALWMLPVVLGLAMAIPLAALTARPQVGAALRRVGLLRVPEETHPPDVLVRALELAGQPDATPHGVTRLLHDPMLLAAHRRMLPPARRSGPASIDSALAVARARLEAAETIEAALAAMRREEVLACLSDPRTLDELAWRAPGERDLGAQRRG
jgi:membrane glycosyltransferase